MSALHRFLNVPASRRAYSSFFSSRAGGGGGRYFNSSKAQKNAVVTPKKATTTDASSDLSKDPSAATTNPSVPQNSVTDIQASASPSSPSSNTASSSSPSSSGASSSSAAPTQAPTAFELAKAFSELTRGHEASQEHISISSKDFKMHQFFSLHRPLLLLPQPQSLFRAVPSEFPITGRPFSTSDPAADMQQLGHYPLGGVPTPVDSVDADAEAARQLTRALTMNQAGATIAWENTLRHLGLDVSKDADRIGLQEQFDKEWQDVLMDSTKRKRRKKMKKHKLKKRRRLTRVERLNK